MATENKCPHCGKLVPTTALGGICPECMMKAGAAETGEIGPGGTFIPQPSQPAPRIEEIAPHFPQLEILECLGRGGMGAVYKARQPKIDRFVALKILSRKREDGPSDAEFAARFQQEARALARLNHPDIVAVYDFGEAGGFHYLLMEYVDGLTLRQLLQSRKLSPEEALVIVPKICEALQFAHQRGIVHRDIKPENILIDKEGRVKIADFGIAKILGAEAAAGNLTGAKDVIGTPHYMAPEQIEKPATVDHRADIYSLGVVFYEMLTGELPLGKFQSPSKKVQVDVRLDEVVLHALEKEPNRRYQHASEVKSDVETIAHTPPHLSPRAQAENVSSSAPKPSPRESAIIGGGLTFFVVGLMVFPFLPQPFDRVMTSLDVVGLIICFLTLAGLWPFPSFLVPDSGFSGRNLPHRRRADLSGGRKHLLWRRAGVTALAVFATVFAVLAIVTFLLPRTYEARAKIIVHDEKLDSVRSDGELDWALRDVIWSFRGPLLQDQLANELKLQKRWAESFKIPDLKEDETRALLAKRLVIERIPRTASFEISCFSTLPEEAAEIANKAAEIFCASPAGQKASLIQRATPPRRHTRPNEPLNLAFAAVVGLVFGFVAGAGMLLVAAIRGGEERPASKREFRDAASESKQNFPTSVGTAAMADASRRVRGPAIGLLVTGILNWILIPVAIVVIRWIVPLEWKGEELHLSARTLNGVFVASLALCSLMIFAALKMMRLECRRTAVAASFAAILVTPGNVIGLPLGIWSLVTLSRADVRSSFRSRRGDGLDFITAISFVGLAILAAMLVQLVGPGFQPHQASATPAAIQAKNLTELSSADRARALSLFNDIEDFGHEFDAAFAAKNLAAAQTGVRRLANLLSNFNAVVRGTAYEFPAALIEDVEKLRRTLDGGDWEKARALAQHNEEYAREFRRISDGIMQLARETMVAKEIPPVVIETFPQSGAADVDPALTEIRATFSKPMQDGNWSWVKLDDASFPEMTGQPRYGSDGRTCVLPVKLKPGVTYALWLNVDDFKHFTDTQGQAAVPYLLIFQTRK